MLPTDRARRALDAMHAGQAIPAGDVLLDQIDTLQSPDDPPVRSAHNANPLGEADKWVAWTIGTPPDYTQHPTPSGKIRITARPGRCTRPRCATRNTPCTTR